MKDVQNSADTRGIAIQKVGIRDAHLPLLIKTKEGDYQQV
ncbi:MAG: GTP cyclohydrolase I FolE2, partial [Anaerovibrio sp.]|nr:GTP cyclohydrolase I FolE2 [Anaerovibrio sp.]